MKEIIDIEITCRLLTFNCSLRKVGVCPGTGDIVNMRPARSEYSRQKTSAMAGESNDLSQWYPHSFFETKSSR
jgi:hypothetical protein